MDSSKVQDYIQAQWDSSVVPTLEEYIRDRRELWTVQPPLR